MQIRMFTFSLYNDREVDYLKDILCLRNSFLGTFRNSIFLHGEMTNNVKTHKDIYNIGVLAIDRLVQQFVSGIIYYRPK